MELVARRFEHESQRRRGGEVEAELVRRARGGAGDRAGKAAVDRAVQVAAEDALDLRMAGDDRSERLAALQTGPVHALDARREGWMVHHQQDRARRRRGERVVEPVEPLRAQQTAALARDERVEGDESDWVVLDRILEKSVTRQITVCGECGAQRLAGV